MASPSALGFVGHKGGHMSYLYMFYILKIFFTWNNLKFTNEFEEWYRGFPYSLHPISSNGITLHNYGISQL